MPESTPAASPGEVTQLLGQLHAGDADALDRLLPLVYGELREAAARAMRREYGARPLQATELVHEAYLRLAGSLAEVRWQDRAHFLAVAARAMRQVLVDDARRRHAEKRGGGARAITLDEQLAGDGRDGDDPAEMLALDAALDRLPPRLRSVVEHRFFGGLTEREIAEVLGVTERTVQRDWARARAWLHQEIYGDERRGGRPGVAARS